MGGLVGLRGFILMDEGVGCFSIFITSLAVISKVGF